MTIELERPPDRAAAKEAEKPADKTGPASTAPSTSGSTALCEIHNLRYDPSQHSGCVVCRRPAQNRLQLAKLALPLAMGLLIGLAVLLVLRRKPAATNSSSTTTGTVAFGSLDPAPYRGTIEQLDQVLASRAPATWQDAGRVEMLARQLSERVARDQPGFLGQKRSMALMMFGSGVGSESDTGIGMIGPGARFSWCQSWVETRDRTFQEATWFARCPDAGTTSTRDTAAAAPPKIDTVAALAGLRQTATALQQLVDDARRDNERFGPQAVLHDRTPEARSKLEAWRTWASGWRDRVDVASRSLPRDPSLRNDPHLGRAYLSLVRTIATLAALPGHGESDQLLQPPGEVRARWLDGAAESLTLAQSELQRAR